MVLWNEPQTVEIVSDRQHKSHGTDVPQGISVQISVHDPRTQRQFLGYTTYIPWRCLARWIVFRRGKKGFPTKIRWLYSTETRTRTKSGIEYVLHDEYSLPKYDTNDRVPDLPGRDENGRKRTEKLFSRFRSRNSSSETDSGAEQTRTKVSRVYTGLQKRTKTTEN